MHSESEFTIMLRWENHLEKSRDSRNMHSLFMLIQPDLQIFFKTLFKETKDVYKQSLGASLLRFYTLTPLKISKSLVL